MADKKIGNRDFQVGVVLATDAILLQARLLKIVGAGVDRLPVILKGAGDKATDEDKAASQAAAVAAFTDIFAECDPVEITALLGDIVQIATVKRQSGVYEQVDVNLDFTNDKGSLFPVVVFVLQEVLGDFFTGIRVSGSPTVRIPKG